MNRPILNPPETLNDFLKSLREEGLFIDDLQKIEAPGPTQFEKKAIHAVNEAFSHASSFNSTQDPSQAAKILEKIQIAAAEAERAAFIIHSKKAQKSSLIAFKLAAWVRHLFHEMKLKSIQKVAA